MKGNVYDEQNQVIYCKYKKKSDVRAGKENMVVSR